VGIKTITRVVTQTSFKLLSLLARSINLKQAGATGVRFT